MYSRSLAALALLVFQVLGLVIPLLTLPILSNALGVQGFGQVMIAQALVLMAVLWVDSGFNTQSQQLAAKVAAAEILKPQALIDNLIARSFAALKAMCVLSMTPLLIPGVSYSLLIASLPLLIGTLLFPQWWLLATGHSVLLGLVTVLGRLVSAVLIWWLVLDQGDIWIATLIISTATLLSGLMLAPIWARPVLRHFAHLSWSSWRDYVREIKPILLPAFLASACAQLPVVALGGFAGAAQTGLFSAADRLTRAGAHLLSLVEQTLVTQWLQPIATEADRLRKLRGQILIILPLGLGLALVVVWQLAPWIIRLLYQDRFLEAVSILQILLVWAWLQTLRRLLVAFFWLIDRHIDLQARIQWFEIALYISFFFALAIFSLLAEFAYWGVMASAGLCLIEVCLIGFFVASQRLSR
jgi:O-antigen/teichoic acid export membrane protein